MNIDDASKTIGDKYRSGELKLGGVVENVNVSLHCEN
jgi:hypothetical protein